MNVTESIIIALTSIRTNALRSGLTLLSISIGVFAIMISATLVSSLNGVVTGQLEEMGETTFWLYKMPKIITNHDSWHLYAKRKPITYSQFNELKRKSTQVQQMSCMANGMNYTIKSDMFETDPDVVLIGTDENFATTFNMPLSTGRGFTYEDISYSRNVAIIGNDVAVKIFPNLDPIGKRIKIKNQEYLVVGILTSKGATMGQSQDNRVVIPVTQFLKYYADEWEESLQIGLRAYSKEKISEAMDEVIGIMRVIRNIKPWEENTFEVETNESLSQQFASFTDYISYFGAFCGIIALIAAGVGIMNIMLVAVKERTREIGVRKAVGAKRRWILTQFIIETVTLCQVGGVIGIIMGIGAFYLLGSFLNLNLVLPYQWIFISIVICTILGVIFGAYPSWKAAKLDPIDALRYE